MEQMGELEKSYNRLYEQKLNNIQERVEQIAVDVNFPSRQVEEVVNRIEIEQKQNNLPLTDWLVYNGFNYQLNHNEKINMPEELKMELDGKVFAKLLKA
jgi:hypothetical protein